MKKMLNSVTDAKDLFVRLNINVERMVRNQEVLSEDCATGMIVSEDLQKQVNEQRCVNRLLMVQLDDRSLPRFEELEELEGERLKEIDDLEEEEKKIPVPPISGQK